jgi:arylformamidase
MTYFDISVPLSSDLPVYSGDPQLRIELVQSMAKGAVADVRSLTMGTHTGTHVDAPAHFIQGGRTVDELRFDDCIGPAQVLDLSAENLGDIEPQQLAGALDPRVPRVLLRTRNSELWRKKTFDSSFTALSEPAARYLVDQGIKLVGIDYLSIAPFGAPAAVHRDLLNAGIVILEGLNLSEVPAGNYTLICLPLKLRGAEGAPARAILVA